MIYWPSIKPLHAAYKPSACYYKKEPNNKNHEIKIKLTVLSESSKILISMQYNAIK